MTPDFGILTLSTQKDYQKAVGLALSLKMTNPDISTSVVCSQRVARKIGRYFDTVVNENNDLKGFEHKIFLDHYSPYKKTFFLDADILVFKKLEPILKTWNGRSYTAGGRYTQSGVSTFGLDREFVLNKFNKKRFADISGAGHAYFEKPACNDIFELARKIMSDYDEYANPCKFADEDVMGVAMTLLEIDPVNSLGFLGSPWHAKKGTLSMNIAESSCEYVDKIHGKVAPYFVHFPRMGFPFLYTKALHRLYRMNNISTVGLWTDMIRQKFITDMMWPVLAVRKKLLGRTAMKNNP